MEEEEMRYRLSQALGPVAANRVVTVSKGETNRIPADEVKNVIERKLGGRAVRLHIIDDPAHAGIWTGQFLQILLAPASETVEVSGPTAEVTIKALYADQPDELRRRMEDLRTKGKTTIPAVHMKRLDDLAGDRLYAVQA
jgi:hypothetical protein